MPKYYSLDEISREINLSTDLIRHKCYFLNIDTKKITKKDKKAVVDALSESISRKVEAKEFEAMLKSIKVDKTDTILDKGGSSLEIMLKLAKKDFDDNQRMIAECQKAIEEKGTILQNGNNGSISANPAVKTKNELLKSQSTLRKDIKELENAIGGLIYYDDDENPFGEE